MRERIGNLSRRELLKLFGISMGASLAGEAAFPTRIQAQSKKVNPRKNARNVIFVQNCGAMSPPECLDFKDTKVTAKDLDIQQVNSDFQISRTIFPNYEKWAPKASLVRSMYENSLVHFSAQYHTQAGRALNAAILREIPAFGSLSFGTRFRAAGLRYVPHIHEPRFVERQMSSNRIRDVESPVVRPRHQHRQRFRRVWWRRGRQHRKEFRSGRALGSAGQNVRGFAFGWNRRKGQ